MIKEIPITIMSSKHAHSINRNKITIINMMIINIFKIGLSFMMKDSMISMNMKSQMIIKEKE